MAQLPLYLTSEIKDFTVGTPKVLESFSKHILMVLSLKTTATRATSMPLRKTGL
ncbi:hypothetical protein NMA510612_0506 [Neisseria meningitidis]|uniref:Uncharacterized protein n=1 Tax=Neisseria meningitidis TaxID=487 RepID=X5EN02_NEIME|nr:hypothetical protein NMA510612_0506 [Neisseria meningitidis]